MSLLKANAVQLGQSITATNNFTWYQPASPDGTVRLGNGNSGSVTDLVTVGSTGNLTFTGTTETYTNSVTISAASTRTLTLNGGAGSNGLVLDASNNVGIGTAPSYKLDVLNNSTNIIARLSSSYAYGTAIQLANSSTGGGTWSLYSFGQSNGEGAGNFGIANVAGTKLTLDSSGNLGLGVTPPTVSTGKSLSVGFTGSSIWSASNSGNIFVLSNTYYNGGYKYDITGAASYYQQNSGIHSWYNAPSGTAGNTISFTQAMTLDASGNLLVGAGAYSPKSGTNTKAIIKKAGIGGLVFAGTSVVDTGISVNAGGEGNTLILIASCNYSTGTNTRSAVYILSFYYDGNNAPVVTYVGGASNFLTFGQSATNTLTITNATGGNASVSWFSSAG